MNWIVARLEEPSTWAGLAALIAGLTFIPNSATWAGLIPQLGVVVAGVLAIVFPEAKAAAK